MRLQGTLRTLVAVVASVMLLGIGCSQSQPGSTDLSARLDRRAAQSSRVTYRRELRTPGQDLTTNTYVEYRAPGNRLRTEGGSGRDDGSTITLVVGDNVLECDGRVAHPTCARAAPDAAEFNRSYLTVALQNAHDAAPSVETIAGEQARCYVAATNNGLTTMVCLAEDGVVVRTLYVAEADNGVGKITTLIEAVDVSRNIDNSVFDPPYPILAVPAIEITAGGN